MKLCRFDQRRVLALAVLRSVGGFDLGIASSKLALSDGLKQTLCFLCAKDNVLGAAAQIVVEVTPATYQDPIAKKVLRKSHDKVMLLLSPMADHQRTLLWVNGIYREVLSTAGLNRAHWA